MERHISDLPDVVKEYILMMLDGISLMRMRTVSKEWKAILDCPNLSLLKKWKDVCKCEIDGDSLRSVLNKLEPKYYICNKPELWKIAYKDWKQWACMPNWEFKQSKLNLSSCEITCIINSGEWLIIGTRNYGSVFAFHYKTKCIEYLYKGENVTEIHAYAFSEDKPLLVGIAHDKLMLRLENITVVYMDMHTLKEDVFEELTGNRQIIHFENKEIKIEVRVDSSIITLTRKPGSVTKQIEWLGHWSVEHCWANRNLLTCSKGYYVVTDDNLVEVSSHPFTHLSQLHLRESSIKCYFGGKVIISVNQKKFCNHEMIVRVLNKENKYHPFIDLSFHVTSIIYYGRLLFAGTDMGSIYVYRIKHIADLLHLSLCSPFSIMEFGSDPIISIAIKETLDKPIVWAASHKQIYQMSFLEI